MSKARALALMDELKITYEDYGDEIIIDPLPKMMFTINDCHWITYSTAYGSRAEIWRAIIKDLRDPNALKPCTTDNCETCGY